MTVSEQEDGGRATWAANSGWSAPAETASQPQEAAGKRYRRDASPHKESPPVETSENLGQPDSAAEEELIAQREPVNPPLPTESEEERLSPEQVWRETLLRAGAERLQELTDRLLSLGGEIQGDRAYVTRIAEGVMAHVTVSVKLRKG